jgi:hypothetical protein
MKIVIFGATGFIGKHLFSFLDKEEFDLTVVTRDVDNARKKLGDHAEFCEWNGKSSEALEPILQDAWAVINLAGEGIASGPWTQNKKEKIISSRTETVRAIVDGINNLPNKPNVLIQASAIGYYGSDASKTFTEKSPAGNTFLAEVSQMWEEATSKLDPSVRLVIMRTGIVIGSNGGALHEMAKPFKYGVGGHLGSGKQWFSWIHIDDEARAILFFLENRDAKGVYNLTAPNPETMKTVARELGLVLHRPVWLHVPAFVIKTIMGQMGKEMLLGSQRVIPTRLQEQGFNFHFEELRPALTNIYNS